MISIETLVYTQKEVADFINFAGSEVSNWKLMIDQFMALKTQNEEETKRLLNSPNANDAEIQKEIEIMLTLNKSLGEAIDECLDQIFRSQQRIRNFGKLIQN